MNNKARQTKVIRILIEFGLQSISHYSAAPVCFGSWFLLIYHVKMTQNTTH